MTLDDPLFAVISVLPDESIWFEITLIAGEIDDRLRREAMGAQASRATEVG